MLPLGAGTEKSQIPNPNLCEKPRLTDEQVASFASLFDTMRRIHTRLAIVEGYTFEEGRIRVPQQVS